MPTGPRWPRALLIACLAVAGCASEPPESQPRLTPEQARAMIAGLLPRGLSDRPGWTEDIYGGFAAQSLPPTRERACGVIAVIAQESGFKVNPEVPGLPSIAWREIDRRADAAGVPTFLVHGALRLPSTTGRSFSERIDHVRTERDLSDIYEDFISLVPMGKRLFSDRNPVRTRGPMQVNVAFAQEQVSRHAYPFAIQGTLEDELFNRRGSVYFGIAHLYAYDPPYDDALYRFADFNAGQFASRNAAFQVALGRVANVKLNPDGALLARDPKAKGAGSTARAAHAIAQKLQLSGHDIDEALELGRKAEFERTVLYQRVFTLADGSRGAGMPRAVVPHIELHGAKLSRALSTDWYAHRVQGRYQRCLAPHP
ncbi:MAG: DUF1615 domain-containing protein [Steroidobacteraceae bacterium]